MRSTGRPPSCNGQYFLIAAVASRSPEETMGARRLLQFTPGEGVVQDAPALHSRSHRPHIRQWDYVRLHLPRYTSPDPVNDRDITNLELCQNRGSWRFSTG
jgi:hypothetical protein